MTREPTQICGVCQSTFGNGDCVHFTGTGTPDDPYIPNLVVDPATGNLIECGPNGLAAFLPAIYGDPPAVNCYNTYNQNIPWDVPFPLRFNINVYDTDGMHDLEGDTTVLTVKTPGIYLFVFNVRWNRTRDSSVTGDLAAFLLKNGTDYIAVDSFPMVGGDSFAKHSISHIEPMVAGDFMSAAVKQDLIDGDDEKLNFSVTAERTQPSFSATFLRPIEGMTIIGMDT